MRSPQKVLIAFLLAGGVVMTSPASPYATQIVRGQGLFGSPPYGDTNAVLGSPATRFYDPFGVFSGGTNNRRVKLVESAFNVAPSTNGLITTNLLLTLGSGSHIIVRFDQPVYDHPVHPYGIDLLVFGNSFYTPNSAINDGTDMNTCLLTGGGFYEPAKVSVSPGYTGEPGENQNDPDTWPWYRYDDGPYADTDFPTEAYKWNSSSATWSDELMDFTKSVNPAMKTKLDAGGLSAADAIDLYNGSGGGAGFDLHQSGFAWIQYVKVEGIDPDFSDGEIDAFAVARPMTIGDSLSIAPENILSNTATLFFQKPGDENENIIMLTFADISDIAQVTTAPLTNLNEFATLPGSALTAVQLDLGPILGTTPVTFTADLTLTTGTNYSGNGNDLILLQSSGTNWSALPFFYSATNHQAQIANVTNLSAFVVVQIAAPMLHLEPNGNGYGLAFTPLVSLVHTLERSTNLVNWSALDSFIGSNSLPVILTDPSPPDEKAFYRLKVNRP